MEPFYVRNHKNIEPEVPSGMPVRKAGGPKYSVPLPPLDESFEDK